MDSMTRAGPALLLWGVPELRWPVAAGFTAERRFQLLALLALAEGGWIERDRIAALLWPDTAMADARRNLRKVLFKAHALVGDSSIEATPHALRWPVDTDLAAFGSDGDLAWRRGPPLQGLDDPRNSAWAAWLAAERARMNQLWLAAAHARLQAASEPAAQAAAARQVLAVEPLDETAVEALLRAERAQGRLAQAQAEYRRYAEALAQELGVEPSHALRDLLAAPAPPASPTALTAPTEGERFIGRRLELKELQALLEQPGCRLVTVLGPGGMGKSSLARQALVQAAPLFPGGRHWLPLQDATSADELPARWAQALGLALPGGDDPLPALLRQLPAARTLLVLDNAEHLPTLPAALQRVLAGAPALVLLVTSRTRLGLADEWLLPLAGLAVPDEDSRDLEAAASFDAVRLFAQRALAAQRGFELAPHLAAVLDITQLLGGLPLALELAASWVRLLPPAQIAADLRSGLDLLEHDPGSATPLQRPEHASLRAVLQGSWQMRGPRERALLAALAVFEGGFTRAAAQAVAGGSMPLLSALVDSSLLAVDETGRFALHPVVHRFAAERLAEDAADAAALRDRHATHFSRQATELAPLARGDQRALQQAVAADYANFRAAWRHALATQQPALLLGMCTPWRVYFETSGRLAEGLQEFRAALALPDATPDARRLLARLRHAISALLYRRGEPGEALAMAQAGAETAEQVGDADALQGCLNNQGLALWHLGRSAEALAPLARALTLAEASGDRHGLLIATGNTALVQKALGRFDEALAANQRALGIARELGNQSVVSTRLNNIGNLHRAQGRWPEARSCFVEGVRHSREFGLAATLHYHQLNQALVDVELGDHDAARGALQALLDSQRELGQLVIELAAEMGLARIDIAQGRPREARTRLQRVLQRSRSRGTDPHAAQVVLIHAEWLRAQGRRDEAVACWQLLATHPLLEEADRLIARRHLQALGVPEGAEPGEALPPLAHWFAQVEAPD